MAAYTKTNTRMLQAALKRASSKITNDNNCSGCACSAGFIVPTGQRTDKTGYQVFVKVARFSERQLRENPESGGLHANP